MRETLVFMGVVVTALTQQAAADEVYQDLASRSHPPSYELVGLHNPWGERSEVLSPLPADFNLRIVTAAKVYADQKIRFDGYMGSDDDGSHYFTAADGEDGAWYGDSERKRYRLVQNGKIDDLTERVWICLDYPIHAVTLAGFPLRLAMAADFHSATDEYTYQGRFPRNLPRDHRFFRRVRNLQLYMQRRQVYSEGRITKEQYRDPAFRPTSQFKVGDIVFMGHYGDADKQGPWVAKHSGIVGSVDARGLPVKLYNMRVSVKMEDDYDGLINQTRNIDGRQVHFQRFSDRYSLVGHGRIVHAYWPPDEPDPVALDGSPLSPELR